MRIDEALALAGKTGRALEQRLPASLPRRDSAQRDPARTPRRQRMHSSRRSPSRSSRGRAVLSCALLSVWHGSIIRLAVPRRLMPCSRLRSRAFRGHPNFPRSRKRKRFSPRWRHEPLSRHDRPRPRGASAMCPMTSLSGWSRNRCIGGLHASQS